MFWKKSLMTASALTILLLGFSTADAHTRQGTWVVQGSASVSSSTGDLYGDENRTALAMSPAVHYFVVDKFAIGLRAPVETVKHGDVSSTALFVGPAVAYYFGDHDATTNPYLGAGVGLRTLSSKNGVFESESNGSSISFIGGLALFLREYLALSPELSVNLESLEGETGTTVAFGVSLAGFLY